MSDAAELHKQVTAVCKQLESTIAAALEMLLKRHRERAAEVQHHVCPGMGTMGFVTVVDKEGAVLGWCKWEIQGTLLTVEAGDGASPA